MSQCVKCGSNFVNVPEQPQGNHMCMYCQRDTAVKALRTIRDHQFFDENNCAMKKGDIIDAFQDIATTALSEIER